MQPVFSCNLQGSSLGNERSEMSSALLHSAPPRQESPRIAHKHWCFFGQNQRPQNSGKVSPAVVTLSLRHAQALAKLIPVLGCGEEAATMAFEGLALSNKGNAAAVLALQNIAAEERVHEVLMRQLVLALPQTESESTLRAARRLHISLGVGSTVMHLARIAALDAAVCTILSRMLRVNGPFQNDRQTFNTLSRIRRDEARHVAVSRGLVVAAGSSQNLRTLGADARCALAGVLMLEADAFETLGIDPSALKRDLERLPDKLLTP